MKIFMTASVDARIHDSWL